MEQNHRWNDTRFLEFFRQMSSIGATKNGGLERQAGSPEDIAARRVLHDLLADEGFAIQYDQIGNQYAVLQPVEDAPYVLVGSHMDSQPLAGRYDGAYGVLAGVFAVLRLQEMLRAGEAQPKLNFGVVNWFNEEGSRFQPSMMGSSVFTDRLDLSTALASHDQSGTTVRDAIERGDWETSTPPPQPAAYVEFHVEQGPVLKDTDVPIGIVESSWPTSKYAVRVVGKQAHTGTTDTMDRHDALLGAARLVVALREIADEFTSSDGTVITSCGELTVKPNSPVVIAREVTTVLDLRSDNQDLLDAATQRLDQQFTSIEREANVQVETKLLHSWGPRQFSDAGMALAEKVSAELGVTSLRVRTRAGHDATNMTEQVPTVLCFVPSQDGLSHNELEFTSDEDLTTGLQVLTELLCRIAIDGELVTA